MTKSFFIGVLCLLTFTCYSQKKHEIDLKLEKVTNTQNLGKALQWVGVVALSGSILLQYSEFKNEPPTNRQIENRENLIKGLAIGGGTLFTVGIFMDIHSNDKKLTIRRSVK